MVRVSEVEKQLLYFMEHFFGARILTINLVDYQNYWKIEGQRF